MPVPGPTRMQGTWGFRGRWKLGALDKEKRVRRLAESTVIKTSWVLAQAAVLGRNTAGPAKLFSLGWVPLIRVGGPADLGDP